jgi:glutathione synthase/RimK-type ligase-like ATP-grasp enzyme
VTLPDIVIVTGRDLPHPEFESGSIQGALAKRGVTATIAVWGTPEALAGELTLIRSTWDYTARLEEFLAWTREAAARTRLVNPASVVEWNAHKSYLLALTDAGVPVVETTVVQTQAAAEVQAAALAQYDGEIVIKPAVSVGAIGARRLDAGSHEAAKHLEALSIVGEVLVQPFEPGISEGEASLLYFGGKFSHAVRKTPAPGDYRVQSFHGGTVDSHVASAPQRAVAATALAAVDAELAYARVDLVDRAAGPAVMELELIEPELFLRVDDQAVERFADHLVTLL